MMLLFNSGFRESKDHLLDPGTMELPAKRMPAVTKELVALGWKVEAEGAIIHPAGEFKLNVTTGIDWFELGGAVDFGGQSVPLPDLLAAARRGETMVELGDGSMGMLPEDWLKKYGLLADLGTSDEGGIRFGRAQAGLLDALLAAQPEIKVDIGLRQGPPGPAPVRRPGPPRGPGRLPRRAPPVSVRGARLARLPPEVRVRRHPRRRHGPGQDRAGARPPPEPSGPPAVEGPVADRRPALARLQLDRRRPSGSPPGSASSTTPAPAATSSAQTFDDHDLIITTYGTLRTDIADLCNVDVRLRDPRRGPGDQERRQPGGQGGPAAQGPAPPGDDRHADREPPGRALVDLRVPQPRHARHGRRLQAAHLRRLGRRRGLARPARPSASARSSSGGPSAGRPGPPREDRADPLLRHGAGPAADLRGAPGPLPPGPPAQGRRRPQPLEDRGARGAPAAPPGVLPPRPDRPGPLGRRQRQARHAPAAARRGRRGGAQGPDLLAVHQRSSPWSATGSTPRGSPTNTSTAGPATAPSGSSGSRPTRRSPSS